MTRTPSLLALTLAAAGLLAQPALAQTAAKKPAATAKKAPAKKAPAKKPTSRQKLQSAAKQVAAGVAAVDEITEAERRLAADVMLGRSECEFRQFVEVEAVPGLPGRFNVKYAGRLWKMAPVETSTGAVRLEDKVSGVVWIQIPTKSMLMDSKAGRRMIDACQHPDQIAHAQSAASAPAGPSLIGGAAPAADAASR